MQEKKEYKEVKEIGEGNYANEYWNNYFNSAPEGVKKYLRFKWDVYENNETPKNLKKTAGNRTQSFTHRLYVLNLSQKYLFGGN